MTLRDELEACIKMYCGEKPMFAADTTATQFLRTHGPALLGALVDAERLDWLQANPHMVYTSHDDGPIAHFVAVDERAMPRRGNVAPTVRQAIDRARGGVV